MPAAIRNGTLFVLIAFSTLLLGNFNFNGSTNHEKCDDVVVAAKDKNNHDDDYNQQEVIQYHMNDRESSIPYTTALISENDNIDDVFRRRTTTTTAASTATITPTPTNDLQHLLPPATGCLEIDPNGFNNKRYRPDLNDTVNCLKYYKPSNYISVMMKLLVGLPRAGSCYARKGCDATVVESFDPQSRKFGEDWPLFGYTMIGSTRMENFRAAVTEVLLKNIPGSVVELGVWRGGAMILIAALMKDYKDRGIITQSRSLYLYDAFESIEGYGRNSAFLSVSQQEVQDAFEFFELDTTTNVHFVKGLFKHTLPKSEEYHPSDEPIAVLRVDGNYYDSHQDVMYNLYERVPVGGIVIFDDIMTLPPVKQFWKDFKKDQGLVENFVRIDKRSGWFRKTKSVVLDRSKMKEPRDINK